MSNRPEIDDHVEDLKALLEALDEAKTLTFDIQDTYVSDVSDAVDEAYATVEQVYDTLTAIIEDLENA